MKKKLLLILLAILGLLLPNENFGQAPDLGAAGGFSLFTSVGAFNNLGPTLVTGDIGTNAGPLTGFPPGLVNGAIHIEDATTLQASIDLGLAYGYLSTLGGSVLGITMGGGQTITPGIYFTGAASTINGDLTLDGEGDPNALFIIRIGGALATGNSTNILLVNGASMNNVYWQVMGQFDLGDYSVFRGTVIADGAINLLEGSTLYGRALSIAGAIALHSNTVILGIMPDAEAGTDRSVCMNESTQIGAAAIAGNTYSWTSDPAGFTSSEANPTVTPLVTTIYTLVETVIITNLSNTHSLTVTVNPLPAAVAGLDQSVCLNESVQIGAPSVSGSTYSWSSVPPGFTSNEANPVVTPTESTIYTVVETITATGCTDNNSVEVTVNPLPAAEAGTDRSICLNSGTQLGANAVEGSTYQWSSVPAGLHSVEANPGVTPLVNTTYTVIETITATGCSNSGTVEVTINPAGEAYTGSDRAICAFAETQLGGAPIAGSTYSWSSVPTGFNSTESNPVVAPLLNTVYTLIVTETASDCTSSGSVSVTVNPLPEANAGNNRLICTTSETQIGADAMPGSTYSWVSDPEGFTSDAADPMVAPLVSTTYTLTETFTATGCSNSNSVSVSVSFLPEAIAGADRSICLNSGTQIGTEAIDGSTYSWSSDPSGFTSNLSNPVVNPLITTTYRVIETNAIAGCSSEGTVEVTVNPIPEANAGEDRSICLNSSTQIGADAIMGSTYRWSSDPNSLLSYQSNPIVAPLVTTTYTVVETITATGCTNANSVLVTVNNVSDVFAGADAVIHENETYTLAASTTTDAISVLWTTSGTGSFDNAETLHPIYTPGISDIQSGTVLLTLTANAASPCNEASDSMVLKIIGSEGLLVTKKALETVYGAVGDIIHYTITVANISNVSINNISTTDANAVITSGNPLSSLGSGKSAIITAIHTITQQDVDAGEVVNCAYASGTYSDGIAIDDSSNCVTVNGMQRPQVTVTKFVTETLYKTAGETIHYTLEVFNCGNVTLQNIVLSDPNAVITGGNPVISLAPRTTVTATAEHLVTQADVAAGKIVNIAYASGFDPLGNPVNDESNEVTLFANMPAQLLVTKFARESSFKAIGDTLHYEIVVKNFRNTPVLDIVVSDPNAVIAGKSKLAILGSGKTASLFATHVITQSDLDAGKVINVAFASGTDFYNFFDQATSNEATVFAQQSPILVVTKTARETSFSKVGELIHYTNMVKNTGNVKITGIILTDPNTSNEGSMQIANLDPGKSAVVTTIYSVTQADLNMGYVDKTASVSGLDGNIQPVRRTSNKVTVQANQTVGLESALTSAESTYHLDGDLIHFTLEVKNTGNTSLTNVKITDGATGDAIGKTIEVLMPGTLSVITAEYKITRSDISAGKILKKTIASAYNQMGEKISIPSNELAVMANAIDRLIVTKFAEEASFAKTGEVLHYTITVRNNGSVPMTNISIVVPDASITGSKLITCLPAASAVTVMATHRTTQADLDAGQVSGNATIYGTYPDGTDYTETSNKVLVNGIRNSGLKVDISAAETSFEKVGQTVNYTVRIENTGNVTLNSISLSNQGGQAMEARAPFTLAPGDVSQILSPYLVTVSDLDAGKVVKTISATGKDSQNQSVDAISSEVLVSGIQKPGLSARAMAVETSFNQAGEVIHYNIAVKNSGNVSIISTAVTSDNAVIITARPNIILLPGESFLVSATHIVTDADVLAGKVVSASKAEGFDLKGDTITKVSNRITVQGIMVTELEVDENTGNRTTGLNEGKLFTGITETNNDLNNQSQFVNFNLSNFPNPFTNETTIVFDLPVKGEVILKVYDVNGKEVGQIDTREYNQGRNYFLWKTNYIQKGIYFLKLLHNGKQASRIISVTN